MRYPNIRNLATDLIMLERADDLVRGWSKSKPKILLKFSHQQI